MELYKLFCAYQPCESLYSMRLPYPKARLIRKLYQTIKEEAQFYLDEQNKLIKEFASKDENGSPIIQDNKISFASKEGMDQYASRVMELRCLDVDLEFIPVKISEKDIGDQPISGEDMDSLAGIVEFTGGEAHDGD